MVKSASVSGVRGLAMSTDEAGSDHSIPIVTSTKLESRAGTVACSAKCDDGCSIMMKSDSVVGVPETTMLRSR